MNEVYNKITKCLDVIKSKADFKPTVALVLGSGLGAYADTINVKATIPYTEIRAFGAMGADVVGMSTACEAVAAVHMSMKACGISCVSNLAAGLSPIPLTHEEVQETADKAAAMTTTKFFIPSS